MNRFTLFLSVILNSSLLLITLSASAQFASGVEAYLPAPGQYTNADFIGTPAAANSLTGTNRGLVSLGAYGGSVVLKFAAPIKNDPGNPYGVDFTIYGNATSSWSEPGIVQVMKDENHNGLADDNWYELAGSDHYWNSTVAAYRVSYTNSGLSSAVDIHWQDNGGEEGIIPANSFHRQSYYPQAGLFPQVPSDRYTLEGTRLQGLIDLSVPGVVNSWRRAFGYADNTPVLSFSQKMPDNPYTPEIEGSGGDAMDIGWAVDASGKHVLLDEIHFIRIYTGMNALAGWLGEISTEVTGIRDVEPAAAAGPRSLIVVQDMLPNIRVGQQVELHALLFEAGIKADNAAISWSVSTPGLAVVENGQLRALKEGLFTLRAYQTGNPSLYCEKELEIYSGGKAVISIPAKVVKVNDRMALSGKLTDQNGQVLSGLTPKWSVDKEAVASVMPLDGSFFLKGLQPGQCWLYLSSEEIPSIRDSVQVQVLPESDKKKVFISVKSEDRTLVSRHSVWAEALDISSHVDRAVKTYPLTDTSFVSLADAIAALYKGTAFEEEWAFRDDAEGGSALYLWRIPEDEEGSTVYHLGYGGSRSAATYRKMWAVLVNQQVYVTGLNKVRVNNGDEILVFHLADNSIPWDMSHLTSGADTIEAGQPVEFQRIKYFCSMNSLRQVSVNASEVMADQAVQTVAKLTGTPGEFYTTDEYGRVQVPFATAGRYSLVSGIDEADMVVVSATGTAEPLSGRLACRVYPNPFRQKINLEGVGKGVEVEMADLYGRTVYSATFTQPVIDLSLLAPGIYVLSVRQGQRLFQQKLMKQ